MNVLLRILFTLDRMILAKKVEKRSTICDDTRNLYSHLDAKFDLYGARSDIKQKDKQLFFDVNEQFLNKTVLFGTIIIRNYTEIDYKQNNDLSYSLLFDYDVIVIIPMKPSIM